MRIEFDDENLKRLYEDADYRVPAYGPELTRGYLKVVGLIVAAKDERDLRALRSLRYEKLQGRRQGQVSLRLHQQWRLIVRLHSSDGETTVHIVEVVDYH